MGKGVFVRFARNRGLSAGVLAKTGARAKSAPQLRHPIKGAHRIGLALVLHSFSGGGSEATLQEGRLGAIAWVPLVLGAVYAATPSPTPYSKLEAITDPARAGSELSLVDWFCRSFAITIDGLSAFLSQMLGPWSQTDLFLQVTPAKLILGFLSALLILVLLRIARRILKGIRHHPKTDESQRYWIDGLLHAF